MGGMETRIFKLVYGLFVALIVISCAFLIQFTILSNNKKVNVIARSFFKEIVTTRSWNALHGGVYVPITSETQPNPDLDVPNRDVVTTDSIKLTLVNPAYMTRQISELALKQNNIRYHITSLRPIREANYADPWETKALKLFESGSLEFFEESSLMDRDFYRFMSPLLVESSCLQCHAIQGYALGDIRGGISVSIDAKPYKATLKKQILVISLAHLLILMMGLVGIRYSQRAISKQFRLTSLKNQQLFNHQSILRETNEKLNEINQQKEKFLSIIAHDLRNPIGAMVSLTEVLIDDKESIDEKKQKLILKNLNDSAKNTYELMDNLLTWARSQQGKIDFKPENIAVYNLVNELGELCEVSAKNKSITINKELEDFQVFADRNMLNLIFRQPNNQCFKIYS